LIRQEQWDCISVAQKERATSQRYVQHFIGLVADGTQSQSDNNDVVATVPFIHTGIAGDGLQQGQMFRKKPLTS